MQYVKCMPDVKTMPCVNIQGHQLEPGINSMQINLFAELYRVEYLAELYYMKFGGVMVCTK